MKLLIVDDEELTRKGLSLSIDADALGIDTILMASDGIEGLELAKNEKPDIILCDVRMPRLNGIEMIEKLHNFLPGVVAIFMSGYSDKEYLISAIRLGAVNYIEKPIDMKDLNAAIRKAMEQCLRLKRESTADEVNTNQVADTLAYYLTTPYNTCISQVNELCDQFKKHYNGINKFKYIHTIIVKLEAASEQSHELRYVYQRLRSEIADNHMHLIYTEKRLFHLVYTIYSDRPISAANLDFFVRHLKKAFKSIGNYYIAVGDLAIGIENAYHSYESAVILLQKSFFFAPCTTLDKTLPSKDESDKIPKLISDFEKALEASEKAQSFQVLDRLFSCCENSTSLLPNRIKTYYFSLFTMLYEQRKKRQILNDMSIENDESIMDIMDRCFSYSTLHKLLYKKVEYYFADTTSNVSENKTIYLIKKYIAANYSNANLSVKDISDYAHMSVSYLCTFFKAETGTTLNQYITEYRMNNAKQLLTDPRNKITEISDRVGYNDGNYFGKSFKKIVGLSPSEYREKVMQ